MSNTLDLIKQAYAAAASDVARDDAVTLPAWEKLPPGYGAAFVHVALALRWNSETIEYELKPRDEVFVHITPKCEHDFKGWREFENGGEQVCTKCGIGAMSDSLRNGP